MGAYRVEWPCCGSVTETDAWEPSECPICEADALRKDAERYRWLRGLDGSCDSAACVNFNIGFDWIEAHGVELDEAIDAAMNGANEQDNGGQQG